MMTQSPVNPLIDRVIQNLIKEESKQIVEERRTVHRTQFFRPITVSSRDDLDFVVRGFSRNISPRGIGLVTDMHFETGRVAVVKIHSLTGEPQSLLAECRWSKEFGDGWFQSGWNFVNVAR